MKSAIDDSFKKLGWSYFKQDIEAIKYLWEMLIELNENFSQIYGVFFVRSDWVILSG